VTEHGANESASAVPASPRRRWYEAGLRFGCQGCGACCSGAPGAVWLEDADIEALAAWLGTSSTQFEREYVRRDGVRRRLYEWPTGDCVLLEPDRRQCVACGARPAQCRSWPFWRTNLTSPEDWGRATAECPGCGQGPLHPAAQIDQRAGADR
jgi:Fe-S-cluster containining protein